MKDNYKGLQKEEEKIYKKFEKFLKGKTNEEKQEFYKVLGEYVDVQIEIEGYCGE